MNENIDLTKILKDCPKGWKFYSSVYGEVKFNRIDEDDPSYPIVFITKYDGNISVTANGKYYKQFNGECILFPSKDQRDWSKFTAPWYKKEKLVKPKFKVGDKIVDVFMKYMDTPGSQFIISEITEDKYIFTDSSYISISSQNSWELVPDKKPKFAPKTLKPFDKVLARYNSDDMWKVDFYSHKGVSKTYPYRCIGSPYPYCIPYNDDTKHLVGTAKEAPEYYRYWEE